MITAAVARLEVSPTGNAVTAVRKHAATVLLTQLAAGTDNLSVELVEPPRIRSSRSTGLTQIGFQSVLPVVVTMIHMIIDTRDDHDNPPASRYDAL